ncbi:MAG: NAD-dependent deacylase [Betaproteobacteria bacterium]|jgi:NAD-dependent deacetylase|nr:NAD-dependent deacylase [Betaproteobacteria bacterium]
MDAAIGEARALLRTATRVAVLTGAGISAESGIPTFRDAMSAAGPPQGVRPPGGERREATIGGDYTVGLWSRFRPEDLATPGAFAANPKTVWEWYAWRRELLAKVAPNAGHRALADLERRMPAFTLITQNVDGLHALAGSRNVIELHGSIMQNRCFDEGRLLGPAELVAGTPPRCPHCGAFVRPGVVWFGEALPRKALDDAIAAARACELFLSVGTSALVEPAASLPLLALEAGAAVIEVNPTPTPLSAHATIVLGGPAGDVLPRLVG